MFDVNYILSLILICVFNFQYSIFHFNILLAVEYSPYQKDGVKSNQTWNRTTFCDSWTKNMGFSLNLKMIKELGRTAHSVKGRNKILNDLDRLRNELI